MVFQFQTETSLSTMLLKLERMVGEFLQDDLLFDGEDFKLMNRHKIFGDQYHCLITICYL